MNPSRLLMYPFPYIFFAVDVGVGFKHLHRWPGACSGLVHPKESGEGIESVCDCAVRVRWILGWDGRGGAGVILMAID